MDLTEYDQWDQFDVHPEAPLMINNIANHRFDGDMSAAIAHVFCRGVEFTPDDELPSSLREAGPLFKTGLKHTALVKAGSTSRAIFGEYDTVPEPFTVGVPEHRGPPIAFGRLFTAKRLPEPNYYQLLDPDETQAHDRERVIEVLEHVRQLADIEDTDCLYAIRQNGTNVTGRGLRGFATAIPRPVTRLSHRQVWSWDNIQKPSEDATLACVLKYGGNHIVVRGEYSAANQTVVIDRVAMPVVQDTPGGTDGAITILESLLPDIEGIERRVRNAGSRPPATTFDRLRMETSNAMHQRGPIDYQSDWRFAHVNHRLSEDFVDRVKVKNPFGKHGELDPRTFDIEPEWEPLVTAPGALILHLRDYAFREKLGGYSWTIQDIGAQQIAGVGCLAVNGTWVDRDDEEAEKLVNN